ncbi:hypothetical protein Y1Q_0001401 [Alligator mississippiensis]|uniref:Uncharacterized protein n=1 Tax=Alligator mississippiensis TaxID=8496 RepID=A0A151M9C6_ALLMI|nr:hypothetical protein Y1Q_0001401 [Alligator mississippiensis]
MTAPQDSILESGEESQACYLVIKRETKKELEGTSEKHTRGRSEYKSSTERLGEQSSCCRRGTTEDSRRSGSNPRRTVADSGEQKHEPLRKWLHKKL